jgi:hypothetical protein
MTIQEVLEKHFINLNVVTMHLLQKKKFMKKYMYWYAHEEPYVPHNIMVERMIESTSSASNVHEVINNNSNPYRNMIMDAMIMNQGHAGQYPTKYFVRIFLLKDQYSLL